MKKNALKERLRTAFSEATPDLLSRIRETCEGSEQRLAPDTVPTAPPHTPAAVWVRRAAACALCLALFFSGLAIGDRTAGGAASVDALGEVQTSVYVDVNPSIEFQLDGNDRVVACLAANGDGETLLQGLELTGVEVNTAMTAVIGAMYVGGYLTAESNSILVSVDAADEAHTEALLTDLSDRINALFDHSEMSCSLIAQRLDGGEELRARAAEYGVSVGKMYLMEKMIDGLESLEEGDLSGLSDMSIGELSLLYATRPTGEGEGLFASDIVSGIVGGFVEVGDALSGLLDSIDLRSEALESCETETRYEEIDGEWRMVYAVTIVLKGDVVGYRYKIDCRTGEILDFHLSFTLPELG